MLIGAGRVLLLFPPLYGRRPRMYHPADSAFEALRGDWEKIGRDLHNALEKAEQIEVNA